MKQIVGWSMVGLVILILLGIVIWTFQGTNIDLTNNTYEARFVLAVFISLIIVGLAGLWLVISSWHS